MTTRNTFALAAAAVALASAPLAAQDNEIETVCQDNVPVAYLERCVAVAQAVDAAQPQLGILMAGGNPILGTASTGGIRLGLIPRVSGTLRVNVVGARFPDVREFEDGGTDEFTFPAPAVGANLSLGILPGVSLAPMLGGFGSVDLLGSVSVLPLELLGDDFGDNAFAWGGGVRVGLLRESFVTPGVSVSLMYRDMGEMSFGRVCEGEESTGPNPHACAVGGGDFGEIAFGLTNWSARAAVSKRLLGLGLTAGVGYDRFETDADLAFRVPGAPPGPGELIYRFDDVSVDNDRWSAFLDGSFTILFGSVVAELGWMQGSDPLPGFPAASDFDPNEGVWFGSLGARLSL